MFKVSLRNILSTFVHCSVYRQGVLCIPLLCPDEQGRYYEARTIAHQCHYFFREMDHFVFLTVSYRGCFVQRQVSRILKQTSAMTHNVYVHTYTSYMPKPCWPFRNISQLWVFIVIIQFADNDRVHTTATPITGKAEQKDTRKILAQNILWHAVSAVMLQWSVNLKLDP